MSSLYRRARSSIARLTGIKAALEKRIDKERARHDAEIEVVETEIALLKTEIRRLNAEITRLEAAHEQAKNRAHEESRRALTADRAYKTNRRRANELEPLKRVLDVVPRWEYGSVTEGRSEWSDKWRSTSGLKILMFAPRDYSGSFFRWTDAVNGHTEHAARLVVTAPHEYGYRVDLVLPNPKLVSGSWRDLWLEADVLHLKDEIGFLDGSNYLPPEMLTSFEGPRVFTQYGGFSRKHQDDPEYQEFVLGFDRVVSMTPDLCFDWLGSDPIYIPHSIDSEAFTFDWSDRRVLGHSPSRPARKGTEEFLEAVARLQQEYEIELDLIEGVSHAESIERKRRLGLFFDQAGREPASFGTTEVIGWYGNSALEAAVYGVPTVAHLSERALAGAERAGATTIRDIPIVNTPLGVDGIRDTIRSLLEQSPEERRLLAKRTRAFVEDFHGRAPVGHSLDTLYQGLEADH